MLSEEKWAIDVNWLETNGRSFPVMIMDYLCPKCRKKLKVDKNEISAAEILLNLKGCCSRSGEFINSDLPLQESAFRVLLANGNRPMSLGEIGQELNTRRSFDAYRTSQGILHRLVSHDTHYGFKAVME